MPLQRPARALAALSAAFPLAGCWMLHPSEGGGEHVVAPPARRVDAADVAVPPGYRVEAVATGLTFPTAVTFDADGRPYVIEAGYSYGEAWGESRLLRVGDRGATTAIAVGQNPPWTGATFHDGKFYVSEGGEKSGGRILAIGLDGRVTALVSGLPSLGDHHTDRPVVSPDGWVYFGQGTATNSGVVGDDNASYGWLKRHPAFHDVPAQDVTLVGEDYRSSNPLTEDPHDKVLTGAYSAFGTRTSPGEVIKGVLPASGAIMRVRTTGGPLELVAWGLRNPFSLAFAPDGRLYATENGYDERGSRPVFGAPDCLWEVRPGTWYGWPDYSAGEPLTSQRFNQSFGDPPLRFLLAKHPGVPPKPKALFGVHASANGLDFSRNATFGHVGEAFVAEFGDLSPTAGKTLHPVGFKVVRANPATGVIEDFAVNRGDASGPASKVGRGGLERPVDARFDPTGRSLYVVDFGVMTMTAAGPTPHGGTGVLWRITRSEGKAPAPAAALERGRIVFMRDCHTCHPGGEGGLGPSLNNKPLPGPVIKLQVRAGVGTMPAFPRNRLSDAELDDLVLYLKAQRGKPKSPA